VLAAETLDRSDARAGGAGADGDSEGGVDETDGSLGAVPELVRRALGAGLSSFFLTEAAIRKAVGDTIPRDWVDFAVDQSDRTRTELLERLALELGRSIERIDLAAVLERLLEGRTLEINAKIGLGARREGAGATTFQVSVEDGDEVD